MMAMVPFEGVATLGVLIPGQVDEIAAQIAMRNLQEALRMLANVDTEDARGHLREVRRVVMVADQAIGLLIQIQPATPERPPSLQDLLAKVDPGANGKSWGSITPQLAADLGQARWNAGLTVAQAAADTGTTPSNLRRLERGDHRPRRDTAERMVRAPWIDDDLAGRLLGESLPDDWYERRRRNPNAVR
jgi:hypothetical protein